MKKSNFIALILGTIGTVFFALGMCMALIAEWEMRQQGTICGVVGLVVLLADLLIWRRMEGKEPSIFPARPSASRRCPCSVPCCWAWA